MDNNNVDLSLRSFIKNLGYVTGGTVILATTPWLSSCTPEKLREVSVSGKARIALIGCGSRGQYHLHNLLEMPHAEVVALCDIYAPNLKAAAELFPKARLVTDYREVLDAADVDGVIIATPLGSHARITLDSLAAGKHTFCEKAMALTMEDCLEVYRAYLRSDRALYYCMQRLYDPKYVAGIGMIRSGEFGPVVGMRCHWFRNADWRREVPEASTAPGIDLERHINWRLYREYSGGLMTELGSHQLEVCNWALGKMPLECTGYGDIVYWKDGREVDDSVCVNYRYDGGCKINYESLISNKFNGMEEQILCKEGTFDLSKGVYYLESESEATGIRALMNQVKTGVSNAIPAAGPSWRPELKSDYVAHTILKDHFGTATGDSMIGKSEDGSMECLSAFCQSCITGEKAADVVEEAYCATLMCLMGNEAMFQGRPVTLEERFRIPYMKF